MLHQWNGWLGGNNMEILKSYSFIVISIGTIFLAISSAIIGSLNLYKGQSLIGDAIGHSTFPGIVLAFMIFQTREPYVLFCGAMITGGISYFLIQATSKYSKVKLDANLAIFLSGFFGLGMVLKSIIQGNSTYQGASQSGLENYIFGQAAYMLEKDVRLIIIVSVIVISLFLLFKKQLIAVIFDKEFATTIGINIRLVESILLIMTISLVSVGLKAVGSILISSFLILPCVAANHWTKKFVKVLFISSFIAGISAIIGTYFSSIYNGLSTGPTIILIMGAITLISMVIGKYGILRSKLRLENKK